MFPTLSVSIHSRKNTVPFSSYAFSKEKNQSQQPPWHCRPIQEHHFSGTTRETHAGSYLLTRCYYSVVLENNLPCIEGAMHHDCPICFKYLFEMRNDVVVMPCGHTIHKNCLKMMQEHYQYSCPLCSKSVCDMSKVWERYDMKIAATPMPEHYRDKMGLEHAILGADLYVVWLDDDLEDIKKSTIEDMRLVMNVIDKIGE